jgi:hypothetical protein
MAKKLRSFPAPEIIRNGAVRRLFSSSFGHNRIADAFPAEESRKFAATALETPRRAFIIFRLCATGQNGTPSRVVSK